MRMPTYVHFMFTNLIFATFNGNETLYAEISSYMYVLAILAYTQGGDGGYYGNNLVDRCRTVATKLTKDIVDWIDSFELIQ